MFLLGPDQEHEGAELQRLYGLLTEHSGLHVPRVLIVQGGFAALHDLLVAGHGPGEGVLVRHDICQGSRPSLETGRTCCEATAFMRVSCSGHLHEAVRGCRPRAAPI